MPSTQKPKTKGTAVLMAGWGAVRGSRGAEGVCVGGGDFVFVGSLQGPLEPRARRQEGSPSPAPTCRGLLGRVLAGCWGGHAPAAHGHDSHEHGRREASLV